MKKFLKIFLGILFLALLVGTFVFLWSSLAFTLSPD